MTELKYFEPNVLVTDKLHLMGDGIGRYCWQFTIDAIKEQYLYLISITNRLTLNHNRRSRNFSGYGEKN